MDESTKASAEEKAKSISQMIGYPDLAADAAKLDKHYEKVSSHTTFADHRLEIMVHSFSCFVL